MINPGPTRGRHIEPWTDHRRLGKTKTEKRQQDQAKETLTREYEPPFIATKTSFAVLHPTKKLFVVGKQFFWV